MSGLITGALHDTCPLIFPAPLCAIIWQASPHRPGDRKCHTEGRARIPEGIAERLLSRPKAPVLYLSALSYHFSICSKWISFKIRWNSLTVTILQVKHTFYSESDYLEANERNKQSLTHTVVQRKTKCCLKMPISFLLWVGGGQNTLFEKKQ